MKAADLGPGWKGGAKKPDLTPDADCTFKRSDLVLTGAAKSEFKTQGASITSESNILQTPAMVAAEWRRSFGSSTLHGVRPKGRDELGRREREVRLVQEARVPEARAYAARYRMVADYGDAGELGPRARGHRRARAGPDRDLAHRLDAVRRPGRRRVVERKLAKLLVSRIVA